MVQTHSIAKRFVLNSVWLRWSLSLSLSLFPFVLRTRANAYTHTRHAPRFTLSKTVDKGLLLEATTSLASLGVVLLPPQ